MPLEYVSNGLEAGDWRSAAQSFISDSLEVTTMSDRRTKARPKIAHAFIHLQT